jgi:YVTN family beta-propeller protein
MGEWIYVLSPTPGGTRLYVSRDAHGGDVQMMVLRARDYAVLDSFPCGALPLDMLFLPNGKYLYVADDPYLASMGKVWAVDVAESRVVKEIPTNRDPDLLAATPDSRFLYVGSWFGGGILVVRTEDNVVVDTIGFPHSAGAVAVSPDGSRLYVSAGKIYVLQVSDYAVIDSIAVGAGVGELAILPDGGRLYASAGGDSGLVYAVSLPGNTVEDSFVIGRSVEKVCVLPGGRFLYASSYSDSSVYVIRTSDDSVVERIPIGFAPTGLAVHPDGSRVYVIGYRRGEFVVLGI